LAGERRKLRIIKWGAAQSRTTQCTGGILTMSRPRVSVLRTKTARPFVLNISTSGEKRMKRPTKTREKEEEKRRDHGRL